MLECGVKVRSEWDEDGGAIYQKFEDDLGRIWLEFGCHTYGGELMVYEFREKLLGRAAPGWWWLV